MRRLLFTRGLQQGFAEDGIVHVFVGFVYRSLNRAREELGFGKCSVSLI